MKAKKRCLVVIDGSNFYFKLRDLGLGNLLEFDFSGFVDFLLAGDKLFEAKYYVGAVKTGRSAKSKKMHANQRRLLAYLKKHKVKYYLGFLLKSDGVYKEKGVDVKMAVDILWGACKNEYDKVFLVSSDSDLIPAVEAAEEEGKQVVYVGFKHNSSYALLQRCRRSMLLVKEDLLPFVKK